METAPTALQRVGQYPPSSEGILLTNSSLAISQTGCGCEQEDHSNFPMDVFGEAGML